MHKGLCCVSSQKCTNKWEQVKNGVNELKTGRNTCQFKLLNVKEVLKFDAKPQYKQHTLSIFLKH